MGEGRREGNPPPNLCSAKIISSVHKVISIVQKITLSFCGAARRGAGARVSVSPSAFLLFSIVNATGFSCSSSAGHGIGRAPPMPPTLEHRRYGLKEEASIKGGW